MELETQLVIAQKLGYADAKRISEAEKMAQEVGRILNGLIESLDHGKARAAAARLG